MPMTEVGMQSSRALRHMPSPARDLGHKYLKLKLKSKSN